MKRAAEDNIKSAPRALLEELFEDYYNHRYELYKLNFLRGVFFGFGTLVGGTIMIALLLWFLSFFDQLPLIGKFVQTVKHSIDISQQRGR